MHSCVALAVNTRTRLAAHLHVGLVRPWFLLGGERPRTDRARWLPTVEHSMWEGEVMSEGALETELRRILKSRRGLEEADHLPLPKLRAVLTDTGVWSQNSATSFSKALGSYLGSQIDRLVEDPLEEGPNIAAALRIDFGIDPVDVPAVDGSSAKRWPVGAAARRDAAAHRAGCSLERYYHDRHSPQEKLGARTNAIRRLVTLIPIGRNAGESEFGDEASPTFEVEAIIQHRVAYGERLDAAWSMLDKVRTNIAARQQDLETLIELTDQLEQETDLDEARALVELARFESDSGRETYRLVQGVTLLESAFADYVTGENDDIQLGMRLIVLSEQANLSLANAVLPGDRAEDLRQLIDHADRSLADAGDPVIEARLRVAIAEALKESAFLTHDALKQSGLNQRAKDECEAVVGALSSHADPAARRLVAQAKRHLAITWELAADKESDDIKRHSYIEEWSRLSIEAAAEASEVGDELLQAYALINAGSAQSRLTGFLGTAQSKAESLAVGRTYIDQALALFSDLNDLRGEAWSYIHLCENAEQQAYLVATGDPSRVPRLRTLESHANHALSRQQRLEDPLGLTLAYLQLGKALCLLTEEDESSSITYVRRDRAIAVLTLALRMTRDIGYYQEAMTASRWLARCLHSAWREDRSTTPDRLVTAIEAQISGLCECYAGQSDTEQLEMLFIELGRRLETELKRHR